jgi:hypothetical protein
MAARWAIGYRSLATQFGVIGIQPGAQDPHRMRDRGGHRPARWAAHGRPF